MARQKKGWQVRSALLGAGIAAMELSFSVLHAEIVMLRKGPPVEGRIVRQTAASIEVTTPKGNKTILKQDIVRIQYVAVTNEQKRLMAEKQKKLEADRRAERDRIERERLAEAEKATRLKQLEERVLAEKKKEAEERAERAAALRELVSTGQMEKPADEPISYMDFVWRSLLVPGWGHFTIDRPVVGSLYMGTAALLLGNAAVKYREGAPAARNNRREVILNDLIVLQPALIADGNMRLALNIYANSNSSSVYRNKVDASNHALYMLGVFYAVQFVHIVYNGIAWENGLLVVDRGSNGETLGATFDIGPDSTPDGALVRGQSARLGLAWNF